MRSRTVLMLASIAVGFWASAAIADPAHPTPPPHRRGPKAEVVRPRLIWFPYRPYYALKGPVGVDLVARVTWAGAPGTEGAAPPAWDGTVWAAPAPTRWDRLRDEEFLRFDAAKGMEPTAP